MPLPFGPVTYGFEPGDGTLSTINNGLGYGAFNTAVQDGSARIGNTYLKHVRTSLDPPGVLETTANAGPLSALQWMLGQIHFWFRFPALPSANVTICGFRTTGVDGTVDHKLQLRPTGQLRALPTAQSFFPCPGEPNFQDSVQVLQANRWYYLVLDHDVANDQSSPFDTSMIDGHGMHVWIDGVLATFGIVGGYGDWAGMRQTSNFTLLSWLLGSSEAVNIEMHFDHITVVVKQQTVHAHQTAAIDAPDCNFHYPHFGGFASTQPNGLPYYPFFIPPTIPAPPDEIDTPGPVPPAPPDEPNHPAIPACTTDGCRTALFPSNAGNGGEAGCSATSWPMADGGCVGQ